MLLFNNRILRAKIIKIYHIIVAYLQNKFSYSKKVIEKVIGHTMLLMYPMTVVLRVMLSIP